MQLGQPILAAWKAKEDLLDLLALGRTHPDRAVTADRLFRFYDRCATSGLPELERLATTIDTWWPEILVFIRAGITNTGSERHQPRHQDHRPRRLWLPQPRKPASTHPLCYHPTRTRTPQPRLNSKSRHPAMPFMPWM
ncbi:transposase [Nonomuraea angiospora]